MSYRVIEYEQNRLGRILATILPVNLRPSFRTGSPLILSPKVDLPKAREVLNKRITMLKLAAKDKNVIVDIEEL